MRRLQVFPLANVANHGDDFAAVRFAQPGNDDGRVETSRVGQHNFFWFLDSLIHSVLSPNLKNSGFVKSLGHV